MSKRHFTLRRAKTEVTRIFGEIRDGTEVKLRDFPFFQVLMCLIGEGWGSPEHGREVNGAVISMRGERNSKLGVWLAHCEKVSLKN